MRRRDRRRRRPGRRPHPVGGHDRVLHRRLSARLRRPRRPRAAPHPRAARRRRADVRVDHGDDPRRVRHLPAGGVPAPRACCARAASRRCSPTARGGSTRSTPRRCAASTHGSGSSGGSGSSASTPSAPRSRRGRRRQPVTLATPRSGTIWRVPDVYTHGHHETVLRSHTWRTAENSAGYLLPAPPPGLDLLDVGCGPGTITRRPRRRGSRRAGCSASTRRRTSSPRRRRSATDAVAFAVGDVYALDVPDGSFDVVHAHQVLQHLTDPVAAIVEAHRVLRPGRAARRARQRLRRVLLGAGEPAPRPLAGAVPRADDAQPGRGRRRAPPPGVGPRRRASATSP